jgi:hypothetical protein
VLKELTNPLRLEIRYSILSETVENMRFLSRCTPEFKHYVISLMKPQLFVPGDIVCEQDVAPRCMYVLLSGSACVHSRQGDGNSLLNAKEWMGDTMLLNQELLVNTSAKRARPRAENQGIEQPVHVRIEAVDYCDCFGISIASLKQALLEFPSNVSELEQYIDVYRAEYEAKAKGIVSQAAVDVGVSLAPSSSFSSSQQLSKLCQVNADYENTEGRIRLLAFVEMAYHLFHSKNNSDSDG